jgi:pimeloyl-ACP methyl ester carboxylesterase
MRLRLCAFTGDVGASHFRRNRTPCRIERSLSRIDSVRRILKAAGLLITVAAALLIGLGAIWEQVERQRAVHDFPAPGRLVDIGGRRIQIDCRGTGSPTVVFESGLDMNGSLSWTKVQGEVAQFTRACAYSRAGIIWSDDKGGPHDGVGVARDLHATLATAGESGPFVLVGHSLGGPYITIYTKLYGNEVAGLVYVDASHPDQQKRTEAVLGKPLKSTAMRTISGVASKLSWMGIVRLGASFSAGGANMPGETVEVSKTFASKSLGPMLAELDAIPSTLDEAGSFRKLGARPAVVLTHTMPISEALLKGTGLSKAEGERLDSARLELQNDMASWSSRSTHRVLDNADHYIQFDRPDVVVTAIREVVDGVRSDASR